MSDVEKKKWIVSGTTTVAVAVTVEADTEEDAVEAAYILFGGLTSYVGNGGTDKLVGVSDDDISLSPSEDFSITEVVPADE